MMADDMRGGSELDLRDQIAVKLLVTVVELGSK